MANLKIELSKLDSEAWPGALDVEKEKLMLIHEKEEFLKELQFVTPQKRSQDELERLEAERQRLEEELLSVRAAPSRALADRWVSYPGAGEAWRGVLDGPAHLSRSRGVSAASVLSGLRTRTRGLAFHGR